jgi:hypothetical protein
VTLWQVNLPCESLQKNFLTCDNYDSVIYGRALSGRIVCRYWVSDTTLDLLEKLKVLVKMT